MTKKYFVSGVGNAIVDVLAFIEEGFLEANNFHKGSMILIDEKDVPKEFYITDKELEKWSYLKGSKSFDRVNKKTGHTYKYSEGKMGFPDGLEKASRTIITGEGGAAASRFKHVINVNGKQQKIGDIGAYLNEYLPILKRQVKAMKLLSVVVIPW